jgi:hypothetical protein
MFKREASILRLVRFPRRLSFTEATRIFAHRHIGCEDLLRLVVGASAIHIEERLSFRQTALIFAGSERQSSLRSTIMQPKSAKWRTRCPPRPLQVCR